MKKSLLVLVVLFLLTGLAAAQQEVSRWDAFTGFSYLASPKLNLTERGFNSELGYNYKRWLALGIDLSYFKGHSDLQPQDLNSTTLTQLQPLLASLPPGVAISVPYDSTTFTLTGGPQLNYRGFKFVTPFIRPALGWLHENVQTNPDSPLTTGLVNTLIGPSGNTTDDVLFYGFGGGFDLNLSKHVALRMAADFIHTDLFKNLLDPGRNSVRVSVGPTIRWGKSVD